MGFFPPSVQQKEKGDNQGPRAQQGGDGVLLAVVPGRAEEAEHQGQGRAQQQHRSYKDPQGTASARPQDEHQRQGHGEDGENLQCDFAVVHEQSFREVLPFT